MWRLHGNLWYSEKEYNEVKEELDKVKEELEEARQELAELKDRFDTV